MLVAGWGAHTTIATAARFAHAAGWPVLADPISGLRAGAHAISTYEALLRTESFAASHRPDIVIRIGAPVTSKVLNAWLDAGIEQVVVDPDDAWLDPHRAATERVVAAPGPLLDALASEIGEGREPERAWLDTWMDAERSARAAIDRVLDGAGAANAGAGYEGVLARDLAAALPDGAALVVASSLPVRALEWCMAPRDGLMVYSNRGANGIDGFVSTAFGIASAGRASPVRSSRCAAICASCTTRTVCSARRRVRPSRSS